MKAHIFKGSLIAGLAWLAIMATPALSRAGVKNFMAVINGAQGTPPNGSTALGNGILTYDPATKTLCYYFSYIGALVGPEILAHIHGPAAPRAARARPVPAGPGAYAGSAGPMPRALRRSASSTRSSVCAGTCALAGARGEARSSRVRVLSEDFSRDGP